MQYRYLGTSDAGGFPGLFCTCEHCRRAAALGGRNLRTRSQSLIDGRLLIDFPPDTLYHVRQYGLDLSKINACIVTHCHTDHLYPGDLRMRQKGYAYHDNVRPLVFYGSAPTGAALVPVLQKEQLVEKGVAVFEQVTAYQPFTVEGYTITPLRADHDPATDPYLYIISDGEHTILHGNDTGYLPEETWDYLAQTRPRLDFVSLDCTGVLLDFRRTHMTLNVTLEVRDRLRELGCVHENTVCAWTHISHNGHATYDDMVPLAAQHGFVAAYDGLTITL